MLAGGARPLTLAGRTVTVNGAEARIYYAAVDEVIFVVPEGLQHVPAEVVVTNADGLSAKGEAILSASAPGVFTVAGDGRGAGIILNADTLMSGPFDPASGQLRL